MKISRKTMVRCLFMCMFLIAFMSTQRINAEAASKKSQAIKAYKKFLSKKTINWNNGKKKVQSSKCKFGLVYIDKDSVPELFVDASGAGTQHIDGAYQLYTFRKGKVRLVCNITDMFSYYKKTGIFLTGTMLHGEYISYRKLTGASERLKLRTETVYSTQYFDAKNNKLTKAQFDLKLKKLVKKKKASIPKCYSNSAKNRKKLGRAF